ncbi:MAG: hypothetical protein IIC26_05025 [Chloroflexi bacterium]|nr:hypothetical protein [Chloroflexota bacterium]
MGWKTLLLVTLLAAGVGGAVGALVVTLWPDGEAEQTTRGQIVRVGPRLSNIDREPWCNEFHHFCIAQIEPGELVALYTYDTQQFCRERGYTVRWVPELPAAASETGEEGLGVFRSGCASIYDMSGRRVFGPAPRNLDRFPLEIGDEFILVDTRTLLCDEAALKETEQECERAPPID